MLTDPRKLALLALAALSIACVDTRPDYGDEYSQDIVSQESGQLSEAGFLLTWQVGSQWTQGHCLDLKLTNQGRDVDYWTLVLQLDATISQWGTTFGAEIMPYDDRLVIEPPEGPLESGETVDFQYCAEPRVYPTSIHEITFSETDAAPNDTPRPGEDGDPTPGAYQSLSDEPFYLLYRKDGQSRGAPCTELSLTNHSNNTLEHWSVELEFNGEANPMDWWGDFTPIYWYGTKVQLIPQSYKKKLEPYDNATATLCMQGDPRLVQLHGDVGESSASPTPDEANPYQVLEDESLTLIYKRESQGDEGCLDMQLNHRGDTPVDPWSIELTLNRSANPTAFSGDFYPTYWSGNKIRLQPHNANSRLDPYDQAHATLCVTPDAQPLAMEATVNAVEGNTTPNPEQNGAWHSLRNDPLSLIYRFDGQSNGGDCLEMEFTHMGDTPLAQWDVDLQLDITANPTDYWGDFKPVFWNGSVIRLHPLDHKSTLNSLESARGTLCLTPQAKPTAFQAHTTPATGGQTPTPTPGSDPTPTPDPISPVIEVLGDGDLYLQYQEAQGEGCLSFALINGGDADLLNWQGLLTLNRESNPTHWQGDFMPLYWDNNQVYLSPVQGQSTIESLEMLSAEICFEPTARPMAFEASYLISDEGGEGGVPPVVNPPETPPVMAALEDGPLVLTYGKEAQSDGSHCLKMRLQNAETETINDWSITLRLDEAANPTDAWGDFLPLYWQGDLIELRPASHKRQLADGEHAEATLCLYPQANPVELIADIDLPSEGDGGGSGAGTLNDGPINLLYRPMEGQGDDQTCLGLEFINLGDKAIETWSAQITFSEAVIPTDWWGEIRPVDWEGTVMDLKPPSYAQSLDALDSATGTLCVESGAMPRDFSVDLQFTDGSTYRYGQYSQAPSTDPISDGPITVYMTPDGQTQGGTCYGLTALNREDYDLLDYELDLSFDGPVTPLDWWGDLTVKTHGSNRITLEPVSHAPTLGAGQQAQMTLCLTSDSPLSGLETTVLMASPPGGGDPIMHAGVALIYTISGTSNGGTCLDLDLFNTSQKTYADYRAEIHMSGPVNITDYWGATPLSSGDTLSLYPPAYQSVLGPGEQLQSTICFSPVVLPEAFVMVTSRP